MILAIDQGSSKTQALVGDEYGTIHGVGIAEGACHFLVGLEASMRAVQTAANEALKMAGLTQESVTQISAGMSGANWPEEFDLLRGALDSQFGISGSRVYNDCVAALYAGASMKDAVVLCAGTAFNAAVLKERQLVWIYNNYIEKEDEGGKSVGERALRTVFRSATQMGEPTSLTQRALDFFGYDDVLSLVIDFDRGTMKKLVKDFARIVDEEALKGDGAALSVQYEYGVSVSRYAIAALKRFHMLNKPSEVLLTGGVFKVQSPVMIDAIRAEIHRVAPLASVVESKYEPVIGAYRLSLAAEREEQWRSRVEQTAEEFLLLRFGKERVENA